MFDRIAVPRRILVRALLGCSLFLLVPVGCARGLQLVKKEPAATPARTADTPPAKDLISPSRLLVKLWSLPGRFSRATRVTLLGDTLYISGRPRGLQAIDARTGQWRWWHSGRYLVDAEPTEYEGTLYLVEGGQFVTLKPETGRELTRRRTRLGVVTPLWGGRESWAIGSTNDRIYGIVPNTGLRDWYVPLNGEVVDAALAGQDMVVALTSKGAVYGVSRKAKAEQWRTPFAMPHCSRLTVSGNTIFIGSEDYYLYSMSAKTGELNAKVCLSAPVLGKPVVEGQRVYVTSSDHKLHVVDAKTYKELWSMPNVERVLTSTDKYVFALRKSGGMNFVLLADAASGKIVSEASAVRYRLFEGKMGAGVFYAVAENGDVAAIAERGAGERIRNAARKTETLSEEQVVKGLVVKLFRKARTGDLDGYIAGLTGESQKFMNGMIEAMGADKVKGQAMTAKKMKVVSVKIAGDEATVQTKVTSANGKTKDEPLHLLRRDGVWRIDLLKGMAGKIKVGGAGK